MLDECEREGSASSPGSRSNTGGLAGSGGPLDEAAERHDASAAQLALAWLLHRSPVMLPIPGTSKVSHLEDNMEAAALELSDDEVVGARRGGARGVARVAAAADAAWCTPRVGG